VLAKPDEALLRVIAAGKTGRIGSMPGWAGVLSEQERRDVLAYLRKNFGAASEKATSEE
jgi:mono/diheme cytochrome c family protein